VFAHENCNRFTPFRNVTERTSFTSVRSYEL